MAVTSDERLPGTDRERVGGTGASSPVGLGPAVLLTVLRSIRLLALAMWLGGLIFFAAVVAPVAFSPAVVERAGSLVISGSIVGTALGRLHWIGLVCGGVLLVVTLLLRFAGRLRMGWMGAEVVAVGAMLVLTAYSQFRIIPRMEVDRRAVGEIEDAPHGTFYRDDFDRLHNRSVQVESGVVIAGLVLLVLVASEGSREETSRLRS